MKKLTKISLTKKNTKLPEKKFVFHDNCLLIGGSCHGESVPYEFGAQILRRGHTYKISYFLNDDRSYPIGIYQPNNDIKSST